MAHTPSKGFLVGATVGGLVAGITALLIAPQSGSRLRKGIAETCSDLSDHTCDMAKKSKSLVKDIQHQGSDWMDCAKSAINKISCCMHTSASCEEEDYEHCGRDLLIGSIAGGILGAAAGLILAPKSGEEMRQGFIDTYEDVSEKAHDLTQNFSKKGKSLAKASRSKSYKWMDLAKNLLDEYTHGLQDKAEELTEDAKETLNHTQQRISDIMEWTSLGVKLWQTLKK
jgi:gas vesicle protein